MLEETSQRSAGDLGTEAFGGDPFWVSELGTAFVTGLHTGGEGSLAVIAKHFPGPGGSDRPPSDEVATVRKSLELLRLVDLAPFFAVTLGVPGESSSPPSMAFSYRISATRACREASDRHRRSASTEPPSSDPGADTLPAWRNAGGLVVS
jgi:beta-N-acetylhexosaminidase